MKAFLRLFEDSWDCKVHTSLFPNEIGIDAFEVLCRESVLEPAGRAENYPCPGGGRECPRVIVSMPRNKVTPFLALCGDRRSCVSQPLREDEVQLHGLNRRRWVDVLRKLYALEGSVSYDVPGFFGLWALGRRHGTDVFLAEKPDGCDLLKFLVGRDTMARPTRLLVPTAKRIDAFLAQRYGVGARTQVAFLEDDLAIRNGEIVRTTPEPSVAPTTAPQAVQTLRLPSGTAWSEVRLHRIDGHTLSVRAAGFHKRVTYIDLGMASGKNREPTKQWEFLMALCDDGGALRWRGDAEAVRRQVSSLRTKLREAFGLDDDPFEPYAKGRGQGWRPRFRAFASDTDDAS